MESEAGLSETVSPIPKPNRHHRRRFALAVPGVLLLIVALLFALDSRPVPPFAWLTQAEMARLTQPGPLTRLKDKVVILTAPLWRHYWNRQPQILIDSRLLTLSAAATDQTGLGAPVATNTNGMRAWILSRAEMSTFLERLKATPDVQLLSRPRIQTASGAKGQMFMGETVSVAGINTPVGVTMELIPKIISGSIRLSFAVTSTEMGAPSGQAATVRTNLVLACRVLLPNAGGLVLDGGNARAGSGTNHWLIISPTAVDVQGRPIKP